MKQKRKAISIIFWTIIVLISIAIGIIAVVTYGYVKKRPEKDVKHNVELQINSIDAIDYFSMPIDNSLLSDTLTIEDIAVDNIGKTDVFVLLNLNIYITRTGYTDFNIDLWKNLDCENIDVLNLDENTIGATKINSGKTKVFNLIHVFDNTVFDNTFLDSSVTLAVKLYSVEVSQTINNNIDAAESILTENYAYTAQNVIDYNQYESENSIYSTTPSETMYYDEFYVKHYNFNVANANIDDKLYVYVSNAEGIFIIPENNNLQSLVESFAGGSLPDGTVVGENNLNHLIEITDDYNGCFDVVTASLTDQKPEIEIRIRPQGIVQEEGKDLYVIEYADIEQESVSVNFPVYACEIGEGVVLEIFNFRINDPTESVSITASVNQGMAAIVGLNNYSKEEILAFLQTEELPEGSQILSSQELTTLTHVFDVEANEDLRFCVVNVNMSGQIPAYTIEIDILPSIIVDFADIKAGTLEFTTPTCDMSHLLETENGLLHLYNFRITNIKEDCEFTAWGSSWITIALYGNYADSTVYTMLNDMSLLPEDARAANPFISDFGFSYQVKAGEDLKFSMILDVPGGNVTIDGNQLPVYLYITPTNELPLVYGDIKYYLNDAGTEYTAQNANASLVHVDNIRNEVNGLPVTYVNFDDQSSLKSIVIPASAKNINFNLCTNLNTVMFEEGSQFTSISQYTFNQCGNLTSLSLPSSITSIEEGSFSVSRKISNITIDSNNKYYHVKDNCLIETATNKLIVAWGIPTIPNYVTSIASYAFINCADLTTITIPKSVTTINSNAFNGCANLQSVIFEENSQLSNLAGYVFSGCSSLALINLPNSVTTIGNYGFSGCSNLSEINLPSNLTTLGNNVFSSCTSLTAIVIPRQVSSIGTGIFLACSNLTSIVVDENNTVYHSKDNCLIETATNKLICAGPASTIPDYVEIIAAYALYGLITNVTISSNVIEIERRAFYGCSDLTNLTLQAKDGYKWQYNDSAYTENWKDCSDNYNYAYDAMHFAYGFRQVAIESVE